METKTELQKLKSEIESRQEENRKQEKNKIKYRRTAKTGKIKH
ncbi:hypothetical protein [Mesomycoplasma ovipneumoniae]|nr:hypothetical protein [Mesomycoplasma ovipneumoniae]